MQSGSPGGFRMYGGIILFAVIVTFCAGCAGIVNTGNSSPEKPVNDPVVGTWNGFIAMSAEKILITDPAINDAVAGIRLNIYPDLTFEYTANFSLQNGTLIPTGKGNYMVKSSETETERKYFRYDEDLDTLKWESRNMSIEFRRNARSLSSPELSEYTIRMLEIFTQKQLNASVTPDPTRAVAHIYSEGFGFDPTSHIIYQMNGNIVIKKGIYHSVGIIIRYPDRDYYQIDIGGMGGSNYTKKDIKIILNDRVINQTPSFFIRLDNREYPAIFSGNSTGRDTYTAYTDS